METQTAGEIGQVETPIVCKQNRRQGCGIVDSGLYD